MTDDVTTGDAVGQKQTTVAQSAPNAQVSLLDSLALLYPNGKLPVNRNAQAALDLAQNPAALHLTAPNPQSVKALASKSSIQPQMTAVAADYKAVTRIQNTTLYGAYFFTIYDFERDAALQNNPNWRLEGPAFWTSTVAGIGLSPVHRFRNLLNGSYLYTIYESERTDIATKYANTFTYEGVAWYAKQSQSTGWSPLYRFRNVTNGTYLFSAYESEKDAIVANYADIFTLEGVAYYVRHSQLLELSLVAGGLGGAGGLDGFAGSARLNYPFAITGSPDGSMFFVDFYSGGGLRKLDTNGQVTTIKLSGGQLTDGWTTDIVRDSQGNFFATNLVNNVIQKITPAGVMSVFAGLTGVSGDIDGTGVQARFYKPFGMFIDSSDNIYLADGNNKKIKKITPAGIVTTIASSVGCWPVDVVKDSLGNLFVYDRDCQRIIKIAPNGTKTNFVGSNTAPFYDAVDGIGSAAQLDPSWHLTIDANDTMYIAGEMSNTLRTISPSGNVTTIVGAAHLAGYLDGALNTALLNTPRGLYVAPSGDIYVADSMNAVIRKVSSGVVSTVGGLPASTGSVDGSSNAARFNAPNALAADSAGNVYVADTGNHVIRKITPSGTVSTFAGLAGVPGDAVGNATQSRFNRPSNVVLDSAGNVYVADTTNYVVKKITPSGQVSIYAGMSGIQASVDGTALTAQFTAPYALAIDSTNNIFVGDFTTIRKIGTNGQVITLAGVAGDYQTLDGVGNQARFSGLASIACDLAGNLYVAEGDSGGVRKVTPAGLVTTLIAADFSKMYKGIDVAGDQIYVSEGYSPVILKINSGGAVATVVGSVGQQGVALGALPASINISSGIKIINGLLYVLSENSLLRINGLP